MRLASIFLVLALAACTPQSDSGTSGPGSIDGAWIAESIGGATVVPPGSVTMSISGSSVSGNGGCNPYSGGLSAKDGVIKFSNLASTLMACLDEAQMRQEGEFHQLLRDAVRYSATSSMQLEISASNGRTIVFARKR